MQKRQRRRPGTRLLLTLAALASVIVGYYLGQYWQRQPLADLSAVFYPSGQKVDYPPALGLAEDAGARSGTWRLFLVADTRAAECRQLMRHFATVFNRMAPSPQIQAHLRLTLLAYDRPEPAAVTAFTGGVTWVEVVSAEREQLDTLSAQLGILPNPGGWCSATAANSILVAPDQTRWALIPYEQAAIMARNILTLIDFVE
jgi:hypothetical protein